VCLAGLTALTSDLAEEVSFMDAKPLDGIRVLDLTWVYAGPFATMMLSDLGAEVIKLEGPPFGDWTRLLPPLANGHSGYFYMLNRRKKSLALDLKQEAGRGLFMRLVERADVVAENFKAGTLDRLGIGYERAREVNPKIIYGSINGFGSSGPYSEMPCVDPVAQAMGGLMSMTGFEGQPPLKTGPAVADSLSGLYLAIGILSALRKRDRTGVGERLEVAMMDCVFSVLEEAVIRTSMTGDPLPARGNTDPLGAPWDAFETSDGRWIMVCNIDPQRFSDLYRLIGREDIADEYGGADAASMEKRSRDLPRLNEIFAAWARTRTAGELQQILLERSIPNGVVNQVPELLEDAHLRGRNMVVDIDHPKLGRINTFNLPIKFSSGEMGIGSGENPLDPELGHDTGDVLRRLLGFDDEEIDRFREQKIIWA
jgi:crotonobetainyl-CoA:carnitine CoA-transferase CaiB-like acyl-CoA transferase